MNTIRREFEHRCFEIKRYLIMLQFLDQPDAQLASGCGTKNMQTFRIDTTTQQVLKANVYLHLYNLVESTITACLRRIGEEIQNCSLQYVDLTEEWRRSWLKTYGKSDEALNADNRLAKMSEVCDGIADGSVVDFMPRIPGNLDDSRIESLARRHGVPLRLSTAAKAAAKRHVVNDLGTLEVVRLRRNDLAHGFTTFRDCGQDISWNELAQYRDSVVNYLQEVIQSFDDFIAARGFERTANAGANGPS